ncbi:MAG: hypothetical protein WCK35_01830 [Chloroflexota bacterium]
MEENNLAIFPKTRIKPYDGMAVTADAWQEAHDEHRQNLRAHNLVFHGSGIVQGLEVIANDPPDQYVFISPGVAIDPAGNVIVLTETVAYDFGVNMEGPLFLVFGHGERESGGVDTEVKHIHAEFVIAARSTLPKRPVVELARVTLSAAGSAIQPPADPINPRPGELDLRFRAKARISAVRTAHVAVCVLGKELPSASADWNYLQRECLRSNFCQLFVECGITPDSTLSTYDLVCLTASGKFKLETELISALNTYLSTGKPLLVEALDNEAETACAALFEKLKRTLSPLAANDRLLEEPYLFTAAPQGQIKRDHQVIYSAGGFSQSWSGKTAANRAEIRSAHEWGINLLNACSPLSD